MGDFVGMHIRRHAPHYVRGALHKERRPDVGGLLLSLTS